MYPSPPTRNTINSYLPADVGQIHSRSSSLWTAPSPSQLRASSSLNRPAWAGSGSTWATEQTPAKHHKSENSAYFTAPWGSPFDLRIGSDAASAAYVYERNHSRLVTDGSPSLANRQRVASRFHSGRTRNGDSKHSIPDQTRPGDTADTATLGDSSPTLQKHCRRVYTKDWLKNNIVDTRESEKSNWWSDDSDDSTSVKTGRRKLSLALKLSQSGIEPTSDSASNTVPEGQSGNNRGYDQPFPTIPSTDPRMSSSVLQDNEEHVAAEKSLPVRPPQFDRTVSEAPVLNSPPNVQHPASKQSRPSLSGIQSFQRPKKRVPWRGKTCIIAIPLVYDNRDLARSRYLQPNEVSQRLQQWQNQGHDTEGFKLGLPSSTSNGSEGQSRQIYPDSEEMLRERGDRSYRVRIPNRLEWEALMTQVNEEKLRALGVSFGDDSISTSTTPALQTTSRNVSSTNSAAVMSPSASIMPNTGSYVDYVPQQAKAISTVSSNDALGVPQGYYHQGKPSVTHYPRYSIVTPNGSFLPAHPLSRPTPPPSRPWSPPQQYGSQPTTRGTSPLVHEQIPNVRSALSPVSTTSHPDRDLASGTDFQQLLTQMQQEQARLQAQQLLRQQLQQRLLFQPPTRFDADEQISSNVLHPSRYDSQVEIASPTPRGHRQNLSETLQKEIDDAELVPAEHKTGPDENEDPVSRSNDGEKYTRSRPDNQASSINTDSKLECKVAQVDSGLSDFGIVGEPKSRSGHQSKPSITKLDATAPIFEYQPRRPSATNVFAFQGGRPGSPAPPASGNTIDTPATGNTSQSIEHSRFNVDAPAFVPLNLQKRGAPSREFSFSSAGPAFKPNAPVYKSNGSDLAVSAQTASPGDAKGSVPRIFGNIDFSEIIKPAKKSKAIPIIKPSESENESGSSSEDPDGQEDESGRITQPEGRQKRVRRNDDDGDQVPLFATPLPPVAQASGNDIPSRSVSPLSGGTSDKDDITPLESATHQLKEIIDELPASEISSLAEDLASASDKDDVWTPFPFDNPEEAAKFNFALPLPSPLESSLRDIATDIPNTTTEAIRDFPTNLPVEGAIINGLGKIEGQDGISRSISSASSSESSKASLAGSSRELGLHDIADIQDFGAEAVVDGVTYINASFNEIDAVMKHLNDEDSDLGVERNVSPEQASIPRTRESPGSHQLLHAAHLRSDAPSPSPNRLQEPYQYLPPTESESADTADRDLVARNARFSPSYRPSRSDAHRLNSPGSPSISDWDDAVSSSEEQKFQTRSSFFDDRVHKVMGDIVKRHLHPLEERLEVVIKDNLAALTDRPSSRRPRRTLSEDAQQSDADDEDDEENVSQPRLKSPARDRSHDRLKASIQAIAATQEQLVSSSELAEVITAVNELKTSLQQAPKLPGDIKTVIEDAIGRQMRGRSGPITSSHQSATAEKSQLQIDGLESMLKIAESRAEDELKARRATEDALADSQRLLRGALQEAAEQRESAEETERSLANFHEERHETLRRAAMLEGTQESLERSAMELSEKNAALESTLEEYRLSSTQWRQEIEDAKAENSGLMKTIHTLKVEIEDSMNGRDTLRGRFERLQEDMTRLSSDIARDQAMWRNKEEEHNGKVHLLSARLDAESRTRERLEVENARLEVQEKEAMKARFLVEHTQKANEELERLVSQSRADHIMQEQIAARLDRELQDANQSAKMEVRSTQTVMEAEIDAARSETKIVRAELESVISRLRSECDDAIANARETKARHDLMLEEASASRQLALREAAEARDAALQEHYRFHERTVGDLRSQHERAIHNTMEDKARSEELLIQRVALADEKVAHYTDRVAHLEERLEISKLAAHAAVQAAQMQKSSSTPPASRASLPLAKGTDIPEKISPQALRESIMVLQEQLQERESRIEQLEWNLSEVDTNAPEKVRNQEMEITWLRELLGVRIDDLKEIISNLSQPTYNRDAIRDAVIRLKTNLEMEQQEKERAMAGGPTFPALSSITNLATSPRALPLAAAAAWGNWRKTRETPFTSLSAMANGSVESTPSRSLPSAQSFLSGLMTPPSTNLWQTPPTQNPVASSRPVSSRRPLRPYSTPRQSFLLEEDERSSQPMDPLTTPPLMRQASYDQDAQSANLTEDDVSAVQRQVSADDEPFGPRIDSITHTA